MGAWRWSLVWVGLCVFSSLLFASKRVEGYPGNVVFTNVENPSGSQGYVTSALWGAALPNPAQTFGACRSCHGDPFAVPPTIPPPGPAPANVRLNGTLLGSPNFNVAAGSTTTFTLTFTSQKANGGFLVMHDDSSSDDSNGRLHKVPGDFYTHECQGAIAGTPPDRCNGTFQNNTEVMHRVPRPKDGSSVVTFDFLYAAPANTCQTYTFGLWINDVNGDLTCFNATDYSVFYSFSITTTCVNDGNVCTADVCSGGFCFYPAGNPGTTCRASAGFCDVAETCNGSQTFCPGDGFQSGSLCRDTTGACDPAEFCPGNSPSCPANTLFPAGTTCRAAAGICDVAETCTGGALCPTDLFLSIPCRASAGFCDVAETCPGNSPFCPANGFQPPTLECRAASCTSNVATLPANCTGSTATCPTPPQTVNCAPFTCTGDVCAGGCATDAQCQAGFFCNAGSCAPKRADGQGCTAVNQCVSNNCVDGVCCNAPCTGGASDCRACNLAGFVGQCRARPAGTTCRASAGACDPAETCDGAAITCPADAKSTSSTVCRAAAGTCDIGETCDGMGDACPADVKRAAGTECRASAGVCDVAELCNGISPACPGNAFSPGTQVCRNAAGVCDVAESCTGSDAACPANAFKPASSQCRAPTCTSGTATLAAQCTGSGAACPAVATQQCTPYVCGPTACFGNCTADVHCNTASYCSAGVCVAKKPTGQACANDDGQCAGGRCVDGFCCDSDCTGQCEACNVTGSVGTCSAVTGDPRGQRAPCATDGSQCGGTCDGSLRITCVYPGAGTSCRDASCDSGVATIGAFCNGAGACPPEFTQDCAGACVGPACGNDCAVDNDCDPDSFCSAGICVPKGGQGAPCPGGNACIAEVCVDGFCCSSACTGQCEACDVQGKEGVCSPVTGNPHGARTACTSDGSVCKGSCGGTNRSSCVYPGNNQCLPPSCTGNVATLASVCSGDGRCPDPLEQSCLPGACSGTKCAGGCTTDGQCAAGQWCSAGKCVSLLAVGDPCSKDSQCVLGFCIDGFCCVRDCAGQCEACDLPGKEGFCETVPSGLPHGGRAACSGSGACGGACLGTSATGCGFPGSDRQCGSGTCLAGVETAAALCNGAGTCLPPITAPCRPYVCGPDACLADCTTADDCEDGYICSSGGACVPDSDSGQGGAAGSAGTAGSAGAAATSGTGGGSSGGSGGSSGSSTDGGAGTSGSGTGGKGGGSSGASEDSGGCGCRVPTNDAPLRSDLVLLGAAVLAACARRRRGRGASERAASSP